MNNRIEDLHPVELLVLAVLLVAEGLALVLVPVVALVLTLASYRRPWPPRRGSAAQPPAAAPPAPLAAVTAPAAAAAGRPAPPTSEQPWLPPFWPELERRTVTELRRLVRAEGLPRSLSRAGRRAELLPALAGAAMAW